jgi:hypothetical protein
MEDEMNQALQVIDTPAGELPLSTKAGRGAIYFIGCTETFRVKIGFTTGNVFERLAKLQTGSPTHLAYLGSLPGTLADERNLHSRFARDRVRGEWFRVSPQLREHLNFVAYYCGGSRLPADDFITSFARRADEHNQQVKGRK